MRDDSVTKRLLTAALAVALAAAGSAFAQDAKPAAAPAKAAPAKSAKPAAKKPAAPAVKLVVEPRAMELLKATADKIAAAKTVQFTAVAGFEFPSRYGPPLVYTSRYDVAMQRPDKLRILMPGDGPASEYYYDGKTAMAYAPAANLVAVNTEAPPTIDAMLKKAFENAAIFFPFTDLLVADPYAALTDGTILAFYIGPSGVVGGVKTDMVAWANDDVFLQIWIGSDDKLPRRVRAVYHDDPLRLRHELELSNWQLDAPIAPETFTSAKALAAPRMAFANPAKTFTAGMKPITERKSAKPAPAKAATKAQ